MSRVGPKRAIRAAVSSLAVLLVAALAACASIPDSGPVRQGAPVAQVNDPLDLDFNPSPPEKGASQQRIVQGFIDAASSPKNNFAIAREYLSRSMAASWNPDESVTVDDGRNRSYDDEGTLWRVEVTPVANVDAVGAFHPVASTAPVGLNYQLVRENGEWRISVAPDGVVIDDPTFRAVYAQQTLYFYSPGWAYLVPDARWFPARVASAATRVASALLAGPAPWLTGAVATSFPKGTQLAVPSVTTAGGVAQVDLSSEAGQADPVQLQRMQYQLEQSLGSLAQSVQLSIEGNVQQVPSLGASALPLRNPPVDSHPFVYRGDIFGSLNGDTVSALSGLSDKIVALQPTAVALTAARDQAAVLSAGSVFSVRKSGEPVRVDARPGLTGPSVDPDGWVWSVPVESPSAIQVTTPTGGDPHSVAADWPGATAILSLAVSRDGTRVAALLRTATGYSLMAAGIVRNGNGSPTSLTDPIELAVPDGTPRSAAWTSDITVAVLSTTSGEATTITQQTVGGEQTTTAGPASGRTIVGASGLAPYVVLSADGTLLAPTGTGWQAQTDKVGAVAVQHGQP
ncbi:LpqB family beta-propeller domain-containing protein [Leifsonia virtsii]|uniref:Lipoprotein LpqB n=1 Tax=Leifsonia virtsii TaxID=3035915 RepID=A0ABT8J027_9MICO|nr:LpqB family beta-propeller domain-containing protein [Leifsonia virtsii]MDN4598433.1 LpqB family beta-propeller domain-containing protein [Leifsonia virtsii]